ncbi:MAG: TIGR04282 family arsenosugar biosynthesis glycosyltransferase [Gomphosphaeria aponina SAG 52.96 = DSM 107014]|uniref:TIGR04282 family arsenosugar biosynthesis glycosyltransferase n=1 Tax=Gomphosphaeria aponina SAG 52.96 = DSM 107014 TaxID=1521640 RepID=A0A941GU65_9CHRO|nr:TIGR04282 family arsenosugar biosynthesis glycosyltransferase [Gomphosphaeria aponina SAG 52.96 = DSM 107014]
MPNECLIIFTRYPEPGKTKTRMIPALGAVGAASLQRQMTEFTLFKAQKIPQLIEVHFAGGNVQLMEEWLGNDVVFRSQVEGDLGMRMQCAFAGAFSAEMRKVVMIGVDCPDLNSAVLTEAFTALETNDLVLGPAADGGYYLIGLNCFIPQLFMGINWGTSVVFAQTNAMAQKLNLKVHNLIMLNDVDLPEDLVFWQKYQGG